MYDPRDEKAYRKSKGSTPAHHTPLDTLAQIRAVREGSVPGAHPTRAAMGTEALDFILRDEHGYTVRIRPDRFDGIWYKLEIRTPAWPRHYLIVSLSSSFPIAAGLAALSEKVQAFLAGTLKPSPDK